MTTTNLTTTEWLDRCKESYNRGLEDGMRRGKAIEAEVSCRCGRIKTNPRPGCAWCQSRTAESDRGNDGLLDARTRLEIQAELNHRTEVIGQLRAEIQALTPQPEHVELSSGVFTPARQEPLRGEPMPTPCDICGRIFVATSDAVMAAKLRTHNVSAHSDDLPTWRTT